MDCKACTKCGETKALVAFSPSKRGRGGRAATCRTCKNIGARVSRPASATCEGCRSVFAIKPKGPIPTFCTWACHFRHDEALRTMRAAMSKRYAATSAGRQTHRRGSAAFYARNRDALPDYRVSNVLKMPVADLTPELLEAKRQQLELHRLGRAIKQHLKEAK